jgi:hypothetical protein
MKKGLLFTVAGLVLTLIAIGLFYLFITGLDNGGNIFFLLGSLVSLGVSIFSFIKATKPAPASQELELSFVPVSGEGGESRLEKNNEMVQQYNKTAKAREELRMMELAGSAGKES